MSELTPLDTVPGIEPAIREKLARYWITSAEELVSTAKSSNAQYGGGLKALGIVLGLEEADTLALIETAQNALPETVSFSVGVELAVGAGAFFDDLPTIDESSFDLPTELPAIVDPLATLPDPQHQGQRNSCVAFTLAAIMQILSEDPTDLSEQFIYWACKDRDNYPGDVGTSPLVGMQVLQELGVCTEQTWPYRPEPVDHDNPGHERPDDQAFQEATQRRLTSFRQLPRTNVRQIQAALAAGQPVLIGLNIMEHWLDSWQSRTLGRVRKPLPGERIVGGHAMCVVGYREDDQAPGKGYFIVRNSWGPEWGNANDDGGGYCHVPFALVFEAGLAAFAAESVEITLPEPTSMSPAIDVDSPTSAPPTPDLTAILAEARAIRNQIDGLIGRIEALTQSNTTTTPATASSIEPRSPASQPQTAIPESRSTTPAAVQTETTTLEFGGSFVFLRGESGAAAEELNPNGINGVTGGPLLQIDAAAASDMASANPDSQDLQLLHDAKGSAQAAHLGVVFDVDQESLAEARWAVVVNALEDAALLKTIWPLIDHRMQQMQFAKRNFDFRDGENCFQWLNRHTDNGKKNFKDDWGRIPPVLIFRPDDKDLKVNTWLARHGTSQGPVDPGKGVPFYLMLLGRPGPLSPDDKIYIPLHFQYELDIFWGVGRLCFTGIDGRHRLQDYATYARNVVDVEQRTDAEAAERISKELVLFGTRHDLDKSTIRSADELIKPLTEWGGRDGSTPVKRGFTTHTLVGNQATRDNLARILRGGDSRKPPAVFFSATHGIGLPLNDERLVMQQGALVTQDWTGYGSIKRDHWFSGEDLGSLASDLHLNGTMAFLFACYGAGCPRNDEFVFDPDKERLQIAPFPFVAQLPQQLLLHGTLAVLGHVERAWSYSFSGPENTRSQTQAFEDVIARLVAGRRAGSATDEFNMIQGAYAMSLTAEIDNKVFGVEDPLTLARLWVARNDARNYALLGDPAVRLPFNAVVPR